jgi:arylsulfatase A-like enzyme
MSGVVDRMRAVVGATLAVVCAASILASSAACTRRPGPPAPAVVLVSIDTLRPDHLGCYGYAKPTSPEIDRFRREAVLFREVVAPASSTLPSHASMLTSLLPQHHGASFRKRSALHAGLLTLAEVLRRAGFATASFNGGGQVHRTWGLDRGFDVYVSATDASEAEVGDDTMHQQVEAAEPWLEKVRGQPFFVFLHTYEVHHPYTPARERLARMETSYTGRLPDRISFRLLERINTGEKVLRPGDLEHIVATYDAEILGADSGFAELLGLLRRLGRYDSSLIIFTSDHGEAFGERGKVGWHGDTLYDEQILVPLIVRLPRGRLAGTTVKEQVRLIDLAPTVLSVLGLPVPREFSGAVIDFAAHAAARPPWAAAVIDGSTRELALRTSQWKWYEGRLYDLVWDPGETHDVVSLHPDVEHDLSGRLGTILRSREQVMPTPVQLGNDVQEQLRALGYVE